jgi:transcription elongation factor Elf1
MVYDGCIVGHPIICKDGRYRIFVKHTDGSKTVMSYPKYLIEVHLGRYLTDDETVDHIDVNPLNNDISNLRVMTRACHSSIHSVRLTPTQFVCPICNKEFVLEGARLSYCIQNRNRGKAGPFCSKSCAGKYGAYVQSGIMPVLDIVKHCPSYAMPEHPGAFRQETPEVDTANSGNPSSNADGNPELD